jgi:nucleoside-diphosphate-sugar epimerase
MELPPAISDLDQLEQLLTEPAAETVEAVKRVDGDIMVLGAAGKMGPTLARMARRSLDAAGLSRRVIAVSRFSSPAGRKALERHGIETIACDLLDEGSLERLPEVPNIVFMAGRKFGSSSDEPYTWAVNTHLPGLVGRRFPGSRIVAFSTGNVYGLVPHGHGGSSEDAAPAPIGEYAMSCLGRERLFEYFSRLHRTPMAILRLNYAADLRYGVLTDLALRVFRREPVDLAMGYFNVIWQGDANAMAIAALAHVTSPPLVVNLAGREELSVGSVCRELARLMDVDVTFTGREANDALLSNGTLGWALLGMPHVEAATLIAWTAAWVQRGGEILGKPTHFESRSGRF